MIARRLPRLPCLLTLPRRVRLPQELSGAVRFDAPVPYQPSSGARKWLTYRAAKAKGEGCIVDWEAAARCSPEEVMDAARALWQYAEQRQEAAASEAETERERLVDESGSERNVEESGEEGGEEGGGDADDECALEGGALSHIPDRPIVTMDMRTWGELLPKALQDAFGPVVELCQATPDACRPRDSTVQHALAARDNRSSKIGRAGAELCVPADQLLLATLPDGRGGVCAAMWAVVESVQRDRRRGPHHKISIVRLVVTPEHRRGDPQLARRNVKLDLLLAIVDAGLREPCDRVAVTLADADCITTKRGAMWRRLFRAVIDSRPAVGFDAEGVDGAQKGGRGRVAALPCLWASPTGAPLPARKPKHPADEACERAEAAAKGAHADATVNPLTGERNALVHPYSQEERAADGEADCSGEEMAEAEEEAEQEEVRAEEAPAEEADAEEGEAEGEGAVEGEAEGAAEGEESDGGEGGEVEREADGGEGGELAVAEKPWAPKDTEELLDAIATQDYGVSDDRSSKLAVPAIKAYNKVADGYHQTLQKKGQPLHEGFTIVKVRAARVALYLIAYLLTYLPTYLLTYLRACSLS